jgi:uncharacterized protein (UPF0333 family)
MFGRIWRDLLILFMWLLLSLVLYIYLHSQGYTKEVSSILIWIVISVIAALLLLHFRSLRISAPKDLDNCNANCIKDSSRDKTITRSISLVQKGDNKTYKRKCFKKTKNPQGNLHDQLRFSRQKGMSQPKELDKLDYEITMSNKLAMSSHKTK